MAVINDSNDNLPLGLTKVLLFSLTTDYNSGGSTYLKLMQAESTSITSLSLSVLLAASDWVVVQETNQCSQELLMRSARF